MDIVCHSVAVVISAVPRDFSAVHPHVGRQVGMVVLHGLVHDGYDDPRITLAQFPRLCAVGIGSGLYSGIYFCIPGVLVVPLKSQIRVVEYATAGSCLCQHSRFRKRSDFQVRCCLKLLVELYPGNLRYRGHRQSGLLQVRPLVESHGVPPVQPGLPGPLLVPHIYREKPAERLHPYVFQYGIEIIYSGAGHHSTSLGKGRFLHPFHGVFAEVHQKAALYRVCRREYQFPGSCTLCYVWRVLM